MAEESNVVVGEAAYAEAEAVLSYIRLNGWCKSERSVTEFLVSLAAQLGVTQLEADAAKSDGGTPAPGADVAGKENNE